jgi:pimeloyl-ACP methyl ester carboxylesterase
MGRSRSRRARRSRPLWLRLLRWIAVVLPVFILIVLAGGGWYYSDQLRQDLLTPPEDDTPEYNLRVIAVGPERITLQRTDDTILEGVHGLEWAGGYGQVGDFLPGGGGSGNVERELTLLQGALAAGDMVRMDRWAFPGDPEQAFGLPFDEVTYVSELGEFPSWLVEGADDTWVIFVHGKGADRREALRMVQTVAEMGFPCLVITYRNDPEAPASPDDRYHLGDTEWEDLEAAVDFAQDRGARDVVLVGYSMGGAIVTSFLLRSERSGLVRGAILDAPVLDWGAAVDLGGEERNLPQVLTTVAKTISALRFGIDWDALEKLDETERFDVPILLFHGDSDERAPVKISDRFAEARPDLVTYVRVPGAEHVGAWNVDPSAYEADVRDFLTRVAA